MAGTKTDIWSSEAYQNSASFVPKLAVKIMQWLDLQKDDVVLDVGCGDGILDFQMDEVLSLGNGRVHGVDASPAMIEAAQKGATSVNTKKASFEVVDATRIIDTPALQKGEFTKAFSNAAMHWILRQPDTRAVFFEGVRNALAPGSTFAFEMGGLGNVVEMRAALLMASARYLGLEKAQEVDPWFFPDEDWITDMMEKTVGGWKVERVEREYRPTKADEGGVEGWVKLMGKHFFNAIENDQDREKCIKEVVDVLEVICRNPSGGFNIGYVRLRVLARKL